MLKAFDFLGPLKWPSLLAVTLVPTVSFTWFWGDFDDAVAMQLYGPEHVGSMPVLLMHRADASLAHETSTRWCARTCAQCGGRITAAQLAYGGEAVPVVGWVAVTAEAGLQCAEMPKRRQGDSFIWLRMHDRGGGQDQHSWRLASGD